MAVIFDFGVQGAQMLLVLLLAPLLTGFTRKVKARLLLRRGPPLVQPYRDLVRLMRKEVVLADNASWLFRVSPYLIFAATWVAASLVPTFRTGLLFSWSADLIAIVALLGSARFFLALAGLDVGTSFGGIGSSREVMIASLAEPAMIMIIFTLALIAGSTQLSTMAGFLVSSQVGLRVSLGLALLALIMTDDTGELVVGLSEVDETLVNVNESAHRRKRVDLAVLDDLDRVWDVFARHLIPKVPGNALDVGIEQRIGFDHAAGDDLLVVGLAHCDFFLCRHRKNARRTRGGQQRDDGENRNRAAEHTVKLPH
jgi:hypothetical protein